ncbi:MAG: DUF4058 family protein [Candidatus Poribacteria bacterium]
MPTPFLEIRLARGGALVTVIEILSPVNKTIGSSMYREKQRNILTVFVAEVGFD